MRDGKATEKWRWNSREAVRAHCGGKIHVQSTKFDETGLDGLVASWDGSGKPLRRMKSRCRVVSADRSQSSEESPARLPTAECRSGSRTDTWQRLFVLFAPSSCRFVPLLSLSYEQLANPEGLEPSRQGYGAFYVFFTGSQTSYWETIFKVQWRSPRPHATSYYRSIMAASTLIHSFSKRKC